MEIDHPTVLIVDDEDSLLDLYGAVLRKNGFSVQTATSAEAAEAIIDDGVPDMVVSDVKMGGLDGISFLKSVKSKHPELPFLLITAFASVKDAVTSLKLGAVDYLEKPVDLDELWATVRDTLRRDDDSDDSIDNRRLEGIIAENAAMKKLFADALKAADSKSTVLLTGESGTGKEVLAQFIHQNSARSEGPFTPVNCASIPASLIASELFGHVKGAFTGAYADKDGYFKQAGGGTLFLDEIGDLPLDLQPSLLRAIETGAICPVGGPREDVVDFRLIAATNKNIRDAVAGGRFREDLFFRLNVICFEIPPLRERPEDVIPLARFFLKQTGGKGKKLAAATARVLRRHHWPGNVRELSNAMERAVVLTQSDMIMPDHLPPAMRKITPDAEPTIGKRVQTLEQVELDMIRNALNETNGNQTRAADLLGISRRTLINKIKKFNVPKHGNNK